MTPEQFLWAVPFTIIALGLAVKLTLYIQRKRRQDNETGLHR